MTVEHFKQIKRLHREFPGHIWCVSSATLGLHIWQKLPGLRDTQDIQIITKTRLHKIGLGGTEVHPMPGRAFRRPFGQDYYTICDDGLLDTWIEQLAFFEKPHTPTFGSIFNALRLLLRRSWIDADTCHLAKLSWKDIHFARKNLERLDQWAEQGFPDEPPVSEAVVISFSPAEDPPSGPAGQMVIATPDATDLSGDIAMNKICNGEWIQHCELWARNGLPCHDSIFYVCSQLARWLYFIELYYLPKEERLARIIDLLTAYCTNKHNGFISRWDAGMHRAVIAHIKRAVHTGIKHATEHLTFTRIRQKRDTGQYKRIIYLETYLANGPVIAQEVSPAQATNSDYTSSSCCAYICCSSTEPHDRKLERIINPEQQDEDTVISSDDPSVPDIKSKRKSAEDWVFQPDHTPLPAMEAAIKTFYKENGWRVYGSTLRKLIALIHYLASHGGEGRIGVESLAKMGFSDATARQHVKRLEAAGIIHIYEEYCPAAGRSNRFKLTKMAMAVAAKKTIEKSA